MSLKKFELPNQSDDSPKKLTSIDRLKAAIVAHQQGRLDEAEKIYQSVLKIHPSNPDALHFLGVLLHQRGRSKEAIAHLERALKVNPDYLDARINLGNIYKETGDMPKAAAIFRKVIANHPQHANAYNNLGVVLRKSDQLEESVQALEYALTLEPNNADFLQNLGNTYKSQRQIEKAIEVYMRSIDLKPKQENAYIGLWRMLQLNGNYAKAGELLSKWLAADPGNPIAQHYFHSNSGGDIPDRASDAYVQRTFDGFAASFDDVLKRLDYRAPELTAEAVATLYPEPLQKLSVLDAGCGTGLCGPFLKAYARQLIGVDLSQAMLEKAVGRKLYDEMTQAELVEYLNRFNSAFDLIVSADTLCYFGELRPFFQAAKQALNAHGCLVFTLEKYAGNEALHFKLNPHGRYSHSADYVEQLLNDSGLSLLELRTVILRKESGEPVSGFLVSAQLN